MMHATQTDTGERRQTVFDIMDGLDEVEALIAQAVEDGDDVTADALWQAMRATEGQIERKLEGLLAHNAEDQADADARDRFMAQMKALNEQADKRIKRRRNLLKLVLERLGWDKATTRLGTITLCKPKVVLDNLDEQAAFAAGLGEVAVTVSRTATDPDGKGALADLCDLALLAVNRRCRQVTMTITITTGRTDVVDDLLDHLCEGDEVKFRYTADKLGILAIAERQLADPDHEALWLRSEICQPRYDRVLQVRGVK